MIMSTNSSVATHRGSADGILRALTSALKRSCIAYITWRMENIAIAQLKAMSDRELEDIGLTRSDIAHCDGRRAIAHSSAAVTEEPQT